VASTKKSLGYFQSGGIIKNCKEQIKIYDYWIDKSDLCFKFEDYVFDGFCDFDKYNNDITKLLGISKVDTNKLKINIDNKKNNITSKKVGVNEYENILSIKQIDEINDKFEDHLKKYDYL